MSSPSLGDGSSRPTPSASVSGPHPLASTPIHSLARSTPSLSDPSIARLSATSSLSLPLPPAANASLAQLPSSPSSTHGHGHGHGSPLKVSIEVAYSFNFAFLGAFVLAVLINLLLHPPWWAAWAKGGQRREGWSIKKTGVAGDIADGGKKRRYSASIAAVSPVPSFKALHGWEEKDGMEKTLPERDALDEFYGAGMLVLPVSGHASIFTPSMSSRISPYDGNGSSRTSTPHTRVDRSSSYFPPTSIATNDTAAKRMTARTISMAPSSLPQNPSSPYLKAAKARSLRASQATTISHADAAGVWTTKGSGYAATRRYQVRPWRAWASAWYNATLLRQPLPYLDWTMGQLLVVFGYTFLLIGFSGWQISSTANAARVGYIALAQIPIVFMLASKNGLLGLIGKGYEKANFLHRYAGRCCILLSWLHGALFIAKDGLNLITPKWKSGFWAGFFLLCIFITASRPIRRASYRVFYLTHFPSIIGWLVALNYHTTHSVVFTLVGLGIFGLDIAMRLWNTRIARATLTALNSETTLVEIEPRTLPFQSYEHGTALGTGWRAGQHVWFHRAFDFKHFIDPHPFTIATAPASSAPIDTPSAYPIGIRLYVKSAGDFTRDLHIEAMGEAKATSFTCLIKGPYGSYTRDFADSERVLLMVAGSGITFGTAVAADLFGRWQRGTVPTLRNAELIWTVRDISVLQNVIDLLEPLLGASANAQGFFRLTIYVTKGDATLPYNFTWLRVFLGRPEVKNHLDEAARGYTSAHGQGQRTRDGIAIGSCGPSKFIADIRQAVASYDRGRCMRVGGIYLHSEQFGW